MLRERNVLEQSAFLQYLTERTDAEGDRLPPLSELSQQLGVSIASLREQLEVARTLGVVEVRPKVGIRRLPYRFKPAVLTSRVMPSRWIPDLSALSLICATTWKCPIIWRLSACSSLKIMLNSGHWSKALRPG